MPPADRLGLVVNLARPNAVILVDRVRMWAARRGVTLLFGDMGFGCPPGEEATTSLAEMGGKCAAVVVLGGDGTILRAAPLVAPAGIPLVAVNTGKFGFLATAESHEMEELLDDLLAGALREEERSLLWATCDTGPRQALALNDIVLHRMEAARVVEYEVRIGDALVSRFAADGVCIATPTGSTAYSLSAGGPVLQPTVEAVIITPLCAHTLAMRSMVVSDHEVVRLRVVSTDVAVHLLVDGQVQGVLRQGQEVVVEHAPHVLRLLQRSHRTFYVLLRQKLGWAGTAGE
ncbi:NAD(+)/NADH kinase [Candidatus Fermentibacteria bacterium]|nr:NAD(+)/NADH kinase [Candidatus Fermentibacteria bacterium]